MKHTFKLERGSVVVEPATGLRGVYIADLADSGYVCQCIFIPLELASVIAQAIEVTGERLLQTMPADAYEDAEKPLINAQALEAAKNFGEGMPV